jgi:hypothetical protein
MSIQIKFQMNTEQKIAIIVLILVLLLVWLSKMG